MSTQLVFSNETVVDEQLSSEPWKILVIDDEPEVHAVTKLALSDFKFLGRSLEFHSAYSGKEARTLIRSHPDAAIILLDVVMETDDAGLKVAKYIREELENQFPRIVLRTGQPGQAPERTVVVNYDINDYKSKTELTAQKLFTSVMASLRSYRDIMRIEQQRRMLEQAFRGVRHLLEQANPEQLATELEQLFNTLCRCASNVALGTVDAESSQVFWLVGSTDDVLIEQNRQNLGHGQLVQQGNLLISEHKGSIVAVELDEIPDLKSEYELYHELLQTTGQALRLMTGKSKG